MAYDELMADRIRQFFDREKCNYFTKKMFGGLCFMVEDKMCCGIHYDKKRKTDFLMARIGEDAQADALNEEGCQPMDFTGRHMKAYVFVRPEGFDTDKDLEKWLTLCLDFNPIAKLSKKRKKKEK